MAIMVNPLTGVPMGDPELPLFDGSRLPSAAQIAEASAPLILSASGWRKVFASPVSGDPYAAWADPAARDPGDSLTVRVGAADRVLVGAMALVWGRWMQARTGRQDPAVLVGVDTRPTGPALAEVCIRVLVGLGLRPRYPFIVAAPEIMALDRYGASLPVDHEERTEGFLYISASHNPPGHNGIKFGAGTGGVLTAAEIAPLIADYRRMVADPGTAGMVAALCAAGAAGTARIFIDAGLWKRRAISAYTLFARQVISGLTDLDEQEAFFDSMLPQDEDHRVGVVAEMNGSARGISIDSDFLQGLGVEVRLLNAEPGAFAHRIVPEGRSLDDCAEALTRLKDGETAFPVGYVPDCDGDRGNLVWFDTAKEAASTLEAQEVFALCCVAELAGLHRTAVLAGTDVGRLAIAVNDATSLRIEAIAKSFGARVFRAETGEANVVALAQKLRDAGWIVRILGEGSNGGNITHPSRVRDPLATLGAILKMLTLRDDPAADGLFRIWLRLSGQDESLAEMFDLGDIVASLPAWATTSVFEPRAELKISTQDRGALKAAWLRIFLEEWEARKEELGRRFGFVDWSIRLSSGDTETEYRADTGLPAAGGLRVLFKDSRGSAKAMLWMRASGTEPVFRILADIEGGTQEDESWLLTWHRAMVERADLRAGRAVGD